MIGASAHGYTFTNLHEFTGAPDGLYPLGLAIIGNTLYGTTQEGGTNNFAFGTVYSLNTDGTGYTVVYRFSLSSGLEPWAAPFASGNTVYGTTAGGGTHSNGTIFSITTSGAFSVLYNFTTNVSGERWGLVLSGSTLYGTSTDGGTNGDEGTVFSVNTNGTGFTILHGFTATSTNSPYNTNSDGARPYAGLILSNGILYGTTQAGGSGGEGVVFSVNTNGTGFTNLHSFAPVPNGTRTNADGGDCGVPLLLVSNTLYGTTAGFGINSNGTVFSVNTDGSGFTVLHSFTSAEGSGSTTPLILSGSMLYGAVGTAGSAGGAGAAVFSMNLDGTAFTMLSATGGVRGSLVILSNTIYGTSSAGNNVFALLPDPPQITQQPLSLASCPNGSPALGVTVIGTPPFGYQWQKNGSNLVDGGNVIGSASNNLVLLNVSQSDAANYDVIITNVVGCATSSVATLFVTSVPATATPVVDNGFIVGATIISGGCGYTNDPIIYFAGQGGTGAVGYGQISDGSVTNIVITDAGFDYPSNAVAQVGPPFYPTLSIAITNTPAAAAIPVITNGFIVGAILTASGSDYTSAPPVTFSDVSGTGAAANAQIHNGLVTNIFITSAGLGYSSNTVINIPPAAYGNAVLPSASSLMLGQTYQLQTASNLNNWTNFGSAFFATSNTWTSSNYWTVASTNAVFFRLQMLP